MRRAAPALGLAAAIALAACAERPRDPLAPPEGTPPAAAAQAPGPALAAAGAADVPHIYMALQPDPGGPTSVVFSIDRSRDGTPSDDPAVRITPDSGACNPQQLRSYGFPPERARRPVYGPEEAARGVTARDLPDFMAMAVTSEMLSTGLIGDPEASRPQNVCTRKLLQRIIVDISTATG